MNPPDRRQAREALSHTYSNWTFIPSTIIIIINTPYRKYLDQEISMPRAMNDTVM